MPYIGRGSDFGVRSRFIYTATAGQTSFSGNDDAGISLAYTDTLYMDVYQNGVLLVPATDYAASTGTSVVLVQGASVDDTLELLVHDIFSVADAVSAKDGGSFAGNVGMGGTLSVTGKITADAGIDIDNFNIDGTTIALSSGDMLLDGAADIILDAAGNQIRFKDNGTEVGFITMSGSDLGIKSTVNDKDIVFKGVDNNSEITALTLDMSDAGTATFNFKVGVGAVPNATFGSLLYAQGTPAANKPIISGYSQGNSNKAGIAIFNDAGNRGIWTDSNDLLFTATYEGNSTEHMRINSSGRQTRSGASTAAGHGNFVGEVGTSSKALMFEHTNGGGETGSVTTGASSAAYNTSSDYRLKENVDYTWDATTRLKQLKPARFNFIIDANTTVDGFLAHEAQAVVPNSVTGTKDEVDEDGVAVMQSIDNSKLVPLLVKTIQELEARLAALEAK